MGQLADTFWLLSEALTFGLRMAEDLNQANKGSKEIMVISVSSSTSSILSVLWVTLIFIINNNK